MDQDEPTGSGQGVVAETSPPPTQTNTPPGAPPRRHARMVLFNVCDSKFIFVT